MIRSSLFGSLLALALLAAPSCRGLEAELEPLVQATNPREGVQEFHLGPPVEVADSGPARFVRTLHEGFEPARAKEFAAFIDRFYRAPANDGYEAVLARLDEELRELGFGQDARLVLDYIEVEVVDAWTPLSGSIELRVDGEEPRMLHAFARGDEVDRVMLPVNTPSCALEGDIALGLNDIKQGSIFVTDVDAEQVMTRARSRGAVAILSSSLYPFNVDRSGKQRHLEAIQFTTLAAGTSLPVFQISARSKEAIEIAVERAEKRGASARLALASEVRIEKRPLRTLMAMIEGATRPQEAVAMVSHVQEPGACDNASGVAGLLESVRALVEALRAKKLAWPSRSLVFLWGDEFSQSSSWLDVTDLTPVVGISSDMTGQAKETGAIALLERNYDPGALKVYGPDFHTPWGAGQVDPEDIRPNGLAVIARCAMADVSLLEGGDWSTAEHPWEGGSDHDIFIRRGIPAVLFWHFTDFTYHTSLDRMEFLDPEEVRRTGVALLATGLSVASAAPGDLERYLRTLDREIGQRVEVARERGDEEQAVRWEDWSTGTREWIINLCRGEAEALPAVPSQK